jgi:hypothetical protein
MPHPSLKITYSQHELATHPPSTPPIFHTLPPPPPKLCLYFTMYILYYKSPPLPTNSILYSRLETTKTNNESKIYLACWDWNLHTMYLIFAFTSLYSRSIASNNEYREFALGQILFNFRKVVSLFSRVLYYFSRLE